MILHLGSRHIDPETVAGAGLISTCVRVYLECSPEPGVPPRAWVSWHPNADLTILTSEGEPIFSDRVPVNAMQVIRTTKMICQEFAGRTSC
jgi:hypothetical protein